ncbi:putative phospholipase B-like 2 [Apostichopus japonicus]|uniref:putative phospholipase B-like 2 n=1 Tax=Stichopus japonicus TaxID=307972 RepID=UPI003AB76807
MDFTFLNNLPKKRISRPHRQMVREITMAVAINLFLSLIVLLSLLPASYGSSTRIASVVIEENEYVIKEGVVKGWIAKGNFTDYIQEHGWSYLTVDTSGDYNDLQQAYAAGFVEGNLTAKYITMMWNNVLADYCKTRTKKCIAVNNFLAKNSLWMVNKMQSFKSSIYWHQVQLIIQQLIGMEAAYYNNTGVPSNNMKVNSFGLLLLQAKFELEDIEAILGFPPDEEKHPLGSGSCSALIKLLPNNTDLFVAHDTWTHYSEMLRVIKKYSLAYSQSPTSKYQISGNEIAFTSYPGVLFSGDDFYVTRGKLVVMETTIGNENTDLWKFSSPMALQTWIRTLVALRLAENGFDWVQIFRENNMGTYNNQWMVIDYNKFTPGESPRDGLFVLAEQLPGFIRANDMTSEDFLEKNSYWASYNIPYFKDIYNMSGAQASFEQYGDIFSYENCPRAKMFRRNHTDAIDTDSVMKLMRYNDFQNDSLGACNCTPPYSGELGISARSDLNPADGAYYLPMLGHRCHGGTDAKVISSSMVDDLSFLAVSGPTWDQQVPFQWSKSDFDLEFSHEGMPDRFAFDPVNVNWND